MIRPAAVTCKRYVSLNASKMPSHLISMLQLSPAQLEHLVDRAAHYKSLVRLNSIPSIEARLLTGRLVAMLFTKRSTRTRVSTEGAAAWFGALPLFLGKDDIQLGVNELARDTATVISSMVSCIFARVNKHEDILDLCQYSSVPIINALCDRFHPLQAITDILTIREAFDKINGLKLAWIGDSNNVMNDLTIAALKSGILVLIAIPGSAPIDAEVQAAANTLSSPTLQFTVGHDPIQAVNGANIIVTDTWISMGQEAEAIEKMKTFSGFRVTPEMADAGKASPDWKFMHCLPRHQQEVSDQVFYGKNSLVFEEAENRLYAAMAVIEAFVLSKF